MSELHSDVDASEQERVKIHEERDARLKVIEFKVEEVMDASPERQK